MKLEDDKPPYVSHKEFMRDAFEKSNVRKEKKEKVVKNIPDNIRSFAEFYSSTIEGKSADERISALFKLIWDFENDLVKRETDTCSGDSVSAVSSIAKSNSMSFGEASAYNLGYVHGLKKLIEFRKHALKMVQESKNEDKN